jgi:CDP-diacylglycerol--glycerol-3-phosphate 3-phosphatidyltransferase
MNLANRITLARLFLVPVVMFFLLVNLNLPPITIPEMMGKSFAITWNQIIACLIFIIAASTDSLDGYIARKHNMVTNLGKLLDPLADKLLVATVLISLVEMDKLSALVVIIIISREFAVTALRQVALLNNVVIPASKWGKWKTVTQIIAIIATLINNFPFFYLGIPFDVFMVWVAAIITIYSGIDYFVKSKNVIPFNDTK